MSRKLLIIPCSLCLLLAGCASAPERSDLHELNTEYMMAVEGAAKRVGTEVVWVNPPRRKQADREDNDNNGD